MAASENTYATGQESGLIVQQEGDDPTPLTCLIHMADNLCKDLGLSYLPEEVSRYDPRVMKKLKLVEDNIPVLRGALAEDIADEVKSMVDQCL